MKELYLILYRPKSRNNINMIEIYFQRENIEKYLPGTKRKIASLYQGSFERKILGLHTTIYKAIEFNITTPLVKRYFSPSERIKKTIRQIEQKYKLNYDVLCAIYYRGTDKVKEINLPSYEEVLQKASDIKKSHPHIHFLLQSDEDGFLKKMQKNFSNYIVFEDENIPRVHIKSGLSKDEITAAYDSNFKHSIYLLSIVIVMSRCKHIICNSSNVSLWTVLYRGSTHNVQQYLSHKKYFYRSKNSYYSENQKMFWF